MEIRKMTLGDYDGVRDSWYACTGIGLNDLDDSREGIGRFLERNPTTCFVAAEDGKIAGSVLAGNDGRRGYIYHLAVRPEYRRRHIASRLVEAVMEALEACGIHKAALVAFVQNTDGNAFWEARGFTVRTDLVYRNRAIHKMIRFDT